MDCTGYVCRGRLTLVAVVQRFNCDRTRSEVTALVGAIVLVSWFNSLVCRK